MVVFYSNFFFPSGAKLNYTRIVVVKDFFPVGKKKNKPAKKEEKKEEEEKDAAEEILAAEPPSKNPFDAMPKG